MPLIDASLIEPGPATAGINEHTHAVRYEVDNGQLYEVCASFRYPIGATSDIARYPWFAVKGKHLSSLASRRNGAVAAFADAVRRGLVVLVRIDTSVCGSAGFGAKAIVRHDADIPWYPGMTCPGSHTVEASCWHRDYVRSADPLGRRLELPLRRCSVFRPGLAGPASTIAALSVLSMSMFDLPSYSAEPGAPKHSAMLLSVDEAGCDSDVLLSVLDASGACFVICTRRDFKLCSSGVVMVAGVDNGAYLLPWRAYGYGRIARSANRLYRYLPPELWMKKCVKQVTRCPPARRLKDLTAAQRALRLQTGETVSLAKLARAARLSIPVLVDVLSSSPGRLLCTRFTTGCYLDLNRCRVLDCGSAVLCDLHIAKLRYWGFVRLTDGIIRSSHGVLHVDEVAGHVKFTQAQAESRRRTIHNVFTECETKL